MKITDQAVDAAARVPIKFDIGMQAGIGSSLQWFPVVAALDHAKARELLEAALPHLVAGVLEDQEAIRPLAERIREPYVAEYGVTGAPSEYWCDEARQVLREVLGVEEGDRED